MPAWEGLLSKLLVSTPSEAKSSHRDIAEALLLVTHLVTCETSTPSAKEQLLEIEVGGEKRIHIEEAGRGKYIKEGIKKDREGTLFNSNGKSARVSISFCYKWICRPNFFLFLLVFVDGSMNFITVVTINLIVVVVVAAVTTVAAVAVGIGVGVGIVIWVLQRSAFVYICTFSPICCIFVGFCCLLCTFMRKCYSNHFLFVSFFFKIPRV